MNAPVLPESDPTIGKPANVASARTLPKGSSPAGCRRQWYFEKFSCRILFPSTKLTVPLGRLRINCHKSVRYGWFSIRASLPQISRYTGNPTEANSATASIDVTCFFQGTKLATINTRKVRGSSANTSRLYSPSDTILCMIWTGPTFGAICDILLRMNSELTT